MLARSGDATDPSAAARGHPAKSAFCFARLSNDELTTQKAMFSGMGVNVVETEEASEEGEELREVPDEEAESESVEATLGPAVINPKRLTSDSGT
jgi:hypothetical protein